MRNLALAENPDYSQNQLFEFQGEKKPNKFFSAYLPSCFIICPLPVQLTNMEIKEYVREYNNFKLRLVGAKGIPGGKIARDMLALFTTEVVCGKNRNNDDNVSIYYPSLASFAKTMGIGQTSYNPKILDILEQFSGCSVYFEFEKKKKYDEQVLPFGDYGFNRGEKAFLKYKKFQNVNFIEKMESIELIREGKKNGESIEINIKLKSEFVKMVKENSVPIDFSVYREIQSSMEKDIYAWLVYRNHALIPNEGVFIPRRSLIEQFGDDNEVNERMKYMRIIDILRNMRQKYYEGLRLEIIETGSSRKKGIVLYQSPLIMRSDDVRYIPLISV
jgi:hypothetical protein